MPTSIDSAFEEFQKELGPSNAARDDETIARYARTTQAQAPAPSCILYPETTEQVQALTRIASQHDVVLYPISCGKNWGYCDACAPTADSAIVDLGRMNRILEVNTDLAYCVIEPGVTQQ